MFKGRLAWDDTRHGPRPGVLVAHTIAGRSAFEERKAQQLAELGYVGFAIDVYGKGTQSTDLVANKARMDALKADRPGLQRRLLATPAEVDALAQELTAAGADWQLHGYGHTMHAFSNPVARDPVGGKAYSESADRRSWAATRYFLAELFD